MKRNIGIYIHIPFCVKKCNYCDFNSGSFSDDIKAKYVDALCNEIKAKADSFKDYIIDTIFIGGGTPSILPCEFIGRTLETLRSFYVVNDNAEISIECNPGTVDEEKLIKYREFGINRISFGLQSANNDELKVLGRIHTYEDFLDSYQTARKVGFDNINIDLMSAIPNQSVTSFSENLKKVLELNPEHISIYSLIIEEGTPFYDMKLNLPDEDDEREMVHIIPRILGDEYHQYEISNYAKRGYECKHNVKYWKRDEYLGFGVSAASLIGNVRFKNIADINQYISHFTNEIYQGYRMSDSDETETSDESNCLITSYDKEILEEYEILKDEDIMSEYIILGLRMNEGIDIFEFQSLFGKSINEIYGERIDKHISEGLLEVVDNHVKLTERGRDLGNYVWADFI